MRHKYCMKRSLNEVLRGAAPVVAPIDMDVGRFVSTFRPFRKSMVSGLLRYWEHARDCINSTK